MSRNSARWSDGMTSHKHGLAAKYNFKMAASEVGFFRDEYFRIAGTLEAETSMSGKIQCLLAISEDNKASFLE